MKLSAELTRLLLALLVLGLFGGAIIIMTFVVVPADNRDVIIQLVGGINALAGLVIGFYFGSTARQENGPVDTRVVNGARDPVPVEDKAEAGQ